LLSRYKIIAIWLFILSGGILAGCCKTAPDVTIYPASILTLQPGEIISLSADVAGCGSSFTFEWNSDGGELHPKDQSAVKYTAANDPGTYNVGLTVKGEGGPTVKNITVHVGTASAVLPTAAPAPAAVPTPVPAASDTPELPSPVKTNTTPPLPSAGVSANQPKDPGNDSTLLITSQYIPDIHMGSIGDIKVDPIDLDTNRFTVTACDSKPWEWDQKYIGGKLNKNAPHFSGILYSDGTWGQQPDSGYDLSQYQSVQWEVRSAQGKFKLEFLIGGVKWTWDNDEGSKVPVLYPDSIPAHGDKAEVIKIATIENDGTWYPFKVDLKGKDLRRVIGSFGWLLSYPSNNVTPGMCPDNPPIFIFEVRKLRFER
jgi:PKD repeat protein